VSYGYGWFVGQKLDRRVTGHEGKINGFKAHIERYPNHGVTLIVLSNQELSDTYTISTTMAQWLFGEEAP
jgi:hypothetical protein